MKKNRIQIYQYFLSLRIFFIFAAACLFIDIIMNIKNILVDAKIWELFLYLIIIVVVPILPFYSSIYLDEEKNILVFRRIVGKKVVIPLDKIKRLLLNINPIDEKDFTIDVVYNDEIKRFDDWSNATKEAFFSSLFKVVARHQIKRLQKFIDQCNEYLEIYQHRIASKNKEDSNSENK